MNYPIWDVPFIGNTWIIGLIACIHIFISHFAVGGGMFFALTEQIAYKNNDEKMYDYLKKHSQFFLLLTSVAGAVTGVGIWWAISLVNPNGTGTLIQTYTLGWAEEYLFFVGELATIFVYYYTWDKISRKDHLKLARIYAFMSIMTLVIINGILTFMLTPGDWLVTKNWLHGFFNETYLPSLIIRLLMMASLAGMYALLTSSRIRDEVFKARMLQYSSKWFLPFFILGPLVGFWFFSNVPPEVMNTLLGGIQTSGIGNFSILTRATYLSLILSGTIVVFVFVGPFLNPRGFSFKIALLFMVVGLTVTSISEWTREMLRKPYVVYNYMYSNGLKKEDIGRLSEASYFDNAQWAKLEKNWMHPGKAIFKYQCLSCHTKDGYRSMKLMLGERDRDSIKSFLELMHGTDPDKNPYMGIMPPLIANEEEREQLADYLNTLNHPEEEQAELAAKVH